jgi:hypothetical protein
LETWSDPELGTFRFERSWWTKTVTLPAFKAFRYRFRKRSAGSSQIPLRFDVEGVESVPTKAAVTVAKRLLRNEVTIVSKLLKALYNDLHGKGPNSGMWWHGDIDSIYEDLSEETGSLRKLRIEKPDSLTKLLGSPSIMIREFGYGYKQPRATICFEALFEVEHGVGILTDGTRILGTGYEMDVAPFK